MTKDEAIEQLRESLTRLMQECELDGLRDIAGYDCWLPEAKRILEATATIEAPTSEAIAKFPTFEDWLASPIIPIRGTTQNVAIEYARLAFHAARDGAATTLDAVGVEKPQQGNAPVTMETGTIGGDHVFQDLMGDWHEEEDIPAKSAIYKRIVAHIDALTHSERREGRRDMHENKMALLKHICILTEGLAAASQASRKADPVPTDAGIPISD